MGNAGPWQGDKQFQSTPPRGGRLKGIATAIADAMFQSTPPRGGRQTLSSGRSYPSSVSIHAPAWGATSQRSRRLCWRRFQSTPPRGGRLTLSATRTRAGTVSIHAPAWGATTTSGPSERRWRVSIHAPAWGATEMRRVSLLGPPVSIHAPAWGATQSRAAKTSSHMVSIHAPAWGATVLLLIPVTAMITWFPFAYHHNFSRVFLSGRYRNCKKLVISCVCYVREPYGRIV